MREGRKRAGHRREDAPPHRRLLSPPPPQAHTCRRGMAVHRLSTKPQACSRLQVRSSSVSDGSDAASWAGSSCREGVVWRGQGRGEGWLLRLF